jgi:hypothetical protein
MNERYEHVNMTPRKDFHDVETFPASQKSH